MKVGTTSDTKVASVALGALLLACGSSPSESSAQGGAAGTSSATGGVSSGGAQGSPAGNGGSSGGGVGGAGAASGSSGATPSGGGSGASGSESGGAGAVGGVPSSAGAGALAGQGGARAGAGGSAGGQAGRGGMSSGGASGGAAAGSAGASGATSTAGAGGSGGMPPQPFKGVANSACADLTRLKASWWYNWTLSPGSCAAGEFVPMVSGKNEKTVAAVTAAITQVANAGYRTVLGFNEPNKVDQSNLSVEQVIALWPAMTSNPALRVGSASTSADAQTWFTQYMSQVSSMNLRTEFLAVHWYGWNAGSCDANAATLESYLRWVEAIPGGRPIWITEWGCMNQSNPDAATVEAFFAGALAMFARHPRIERYAWYPWNPHNELVDASGALTRLGMAFAAAPAYKAAP